MPAALALVLASRDSKREARGPCPSPSHALCSARAGCLEAQPASGLHSGVIEAGSPALHGRRRLAWLRARNSIPMTTKILGMTSNSWSAHAAASRKLGDQRLPSLVSSS